MTDNLWMLKLAIMIQAVAVVMYLVATGMMLYNNYAGRAGGK